MDELDEWKNRPKRKPLILRGARQVGKTWLMKYFGKEMYKQVAYINLDNNQRMTNLFAGDYRIERLIMGFEIETGLKISAEDTLIILDEIQENPKALTSLKYFYEDAPEYHVIAAGSLLGVALQKESSFPVGKVSFLDLYPLDFEEYLLARNKNNMVELLKRKDYEMISSFKDQYIELLKQYYYVGGMPEVVAHFTESKDYLEARRIQQQLLQAYEQDISKHAPSNIVPRIRMLWNSIPTQLAKENRKFIYGLIKSGARAREYELAMNWLVDSGLIYKVNRITKPSIPIAAYEDLKSFKLFVLDVGLLAALSNLSVEAIISGNAVFTEFKGALTEQYVMGQLMKKGSASVKYWSAENATSEVDFVVQRGVEIIPIEVKAEENLQAKSLKNYTEKYGPSTAIRASMSDYREEDWLTNIPLYCI